MESGRLTTQLETQIRYINHHTNNDTQTTSQKYRSIYTTSEHRKAKCYRQQTKRNKTHRQLCQTLLAILLV